MDVTTEVRWFFEGPLPAAVQAWAEAQGARAEARTDHYLAPSSAALGVKVREGALEVKQRRKVRRARALAPGVAGRVADWAKWRFDTPAPAPEGWLAVDKKRWLATGAEAEAARCELEVAALAGAGGTAWTVCFEASGAAEVARYRALGEAVRRAVAEGLPVALPASAAQGYPAWLRARTARR